MPTSAGAVEATQLQGGVNLTHITPAAHDTADFSEPPGSLRVDYVLPSKQLRIKDSGVFWPVSSDPLSALTGTYPFPSSGSPAGVGRRAGARKGPLGAAGSGRGSLAGLLRVLAAQHGDGTIVEETGVGAAVEAHHCCLAAEVDRLDAVRHAALARVVMVAPVCSSESARCDCRAGRGLSSRHGVLR